ncbi:MAG: hypothetical protein KJ831_09400 [Candidatus Eisenbacteria bacterium]|nr:hypothetical protein [Candidatus Eisenbacteria bacterium]
MRRTSPVIVLVGSIVFLFLSCGREKLTEPSNSTDFTIGTITPLDVNLAPGGEIADPVSGGTFIFPEGGSGLLEVAEISKAPAAPYSGTDLYINYDGDTPLKLRLPLSGNDEMMLLGWGVPSGSLDLPAGGERWIALPAMINGGLIEFELAMPFDLPDKRSNRRGYTYHHLSSIPAGSSDAVRLAALRTQAAADIEAYLNALPTAMQPSMRTRAAAMVPTYYADGNYYIGFARYIWGNTVRPMIGLEAGASESTVAHEVGHYMHHILTSDGQYLLIENTAPDTHGIGDLHDGRTTIIEDVAYFSQFLLRGSVGIADPTEPGFMYRGISPYVVDAPSIEGFGCVLLSRLWSADPTIGRIDRPTERRPIPTVNLSMAEILSLISLGATNINQLKADVETYLTGVGKADRLPVILERIGWRYLFRARLVDINGDPLENVTMRKFTKANGVEYAPYTKFGTTDDDGYITLAHAFPGKTTLRVPLLGDSIDVPISIDPLLPTNREVDLGEVVVGDSLDFNLANYGNIKLSVYASEQYLDRIHHYWFEPSMWTSCQGAFDGDTFTSELDEIDNNGNHMTSSLSISIDIRSGQVTSFRWNYTLQSGYYANETRAWEVTGGGVPMTTYSESGTSLSYEAELTGTAVCSSISTLTSHSTDIAGNEAQLLSYECDDQSGGGPARIWLKLSSVE